MPRGDDEEIVPRWEALLAFGELLFGERLLVGLLAGERFLSEPLTGELLIGELLAAGRNFLE